MRLDVPALRRDRREDIPAGGSLPRALPGRILGKPVRGIARRRAGAADTATAGPATSASSRTCIERAMILVDGERITLAELPPSNVVNVRRTTPRAEGSASPLDLKRASGTAALRSRDDPPRSPQHQAATGPTLRAGSSRSATARCSTRSRNTGSATTEPPQLGELARPAHKRGAAPRPGGHDAARDSRLASTWARVGTRSKACSIRSGRDQFRTRSISTVSASTMAPVAAPVHSMRTGAGADSSGVGIWA